MSVGLTLLPARRKEKERASMVSTAFYGARGDVPGRIASVILIDEMYNFKTTTAKTIPVLNNGLKFFLLQSQHLVYSTVHRRPNICAASFLSIILTSVKSSTSLTRNTRRRLKNASAKAL